MTQATQTPPSTRPDRADGHTRSHHSTWTLGVWPEGSATWYWFDDTKQRVRGPFASEAAGRAWYGHRFNG